MAADRGVEAGGFAETFFFPQPESSIPENKIKASARAHHEAFIRELIISFSPYLGTQRSTESSQTSTFSAQSLP